jgi:hypothetical protein
MSPKRELIKLLNNLKKPRPLLPAECNELITLLDGTTKPRQRPEVKIFNGSLRSGNWTAIATVVFSFLENAEQLSKYEAELEDSYRPHFLENIVESASTKNPSAYRIDLEKRLPEERTYLKALIDGLRPATAKNRPVGFMQPVLTIRISGPVVGALIAALILLLETQKARFGQYRLSVMPRITA